MESNILQRKNILELIELLKNENKKEVPDSNVVEAIEKEIMRKFNAVSDLLLIAQKREGLDILYYVKTLLKHKLYNDLYTFATEVVEILEKAAAQNTQ